MYSTCLHCHRSLGRNEAIEHFPVGRRLAFDSAKGRLWVVCAHCGRWNLTPIEERWEAVEESEKVFRAQRLRAQTDNIGLAKLREGTELIRIGAPLRPEFAAWRYGRVLQRRLYGRAMMISGAGSVIGAATVAASGVVTNGAMVAAVSPLLVLPFVHIALGALAVRGTVIRTKVIGEDGKPLLVTSRNLDHTHLDASDPAQLALDLKHTYGRQQLTGDRAVRALATLLAFANRGGGTTRNVDEAARFIAESGDARDAIARVAREAEKRGEHFEERAAEFARGPRGRTMKEAMENQMRMQQRAMSEWQLSNMPPTNPGALHRLPRPLRLALEMSIHETSEQKALEEDLSLLERDWREAEEIAGIADGLLGPRTPSR